MRPGKIEYTLRESPRAKRIILKVGINGLQIIVPLGLNKSKLPDILEVKRQWIERELQKAKELPALIAPETISLNAIDEHWQVNYQSDPTSNGKLSLKEHSLNRLMVYGEEDDIYNVASMLTQWLHLKAHAHLVPWLEEISREVRIPFKKTQVRGQTTRWASCSNIGNISLNRSLLFLPTHLVRHVFLHELCHINELNHSPKFWRLLRQLEPACKFLENEIHEAKQYVPPWVLFLPHISGNRSR